MAAYARPTRIDQALKLLALGARTVVAGGTDFYPARVGKSSHEPVLDLSAIRGLRGIESPGDSWRIGATTTWSDLLEAKLPPLFDGLKLAAREIGGRQIQNSGTLAGNLCNASPAADGVPPLLALDASVELASVEGTRLLPLSKFIVGPRQTALTARELLRAVHVPRPPHEALSGFLKLGARRYQVISIAMVAAVIEHKNGLVRAARVAVGACSPVACRLQKLERELIGKRVGAELARCVRPEHLARLVPIDDVRGSGAYRLQAASVLLRRMLGQLA